MERKSWIYAATLVLGSTAFIGFFTFSHTHAQISASDLETSQSKTQHIDSQQHKDSPTSHSSSRMKQMMNHQEPDQHFMEMMVPHHQKSIDAANLALTKAKRAEIKELAEKMKKDQSQEIEQMKTLYKQWYGKDLPPHNMSAHSGTGNNHDSHQGTAQHSSTATNHGSNQGTAQHSSTATNHGSNHSMEMMSHCREMMNAMKMDLEAMKNAPDFDKAFIQGMSKHQKKAVMMASMVLDSKRAEVRNLAKNIIEDGSAEIEQMQQWN